MRLPPGRNQRFDFGSRALHYIGLAEIAIVGQQCFGPAELFRQSVDLLQHRRDLLLVVGRLNHCRGDHQKARRRHHRLRVVALVEAAARHRLIREFALPCTVPANHERHNQSINNSGW